MSMKHYLVYHSVKKMGHSFRDGDDGESGGEGGFGIVTGKSVAGLPGSVVWLISGEGQPRDYRLEYWFVVAGTEQLDDDGAFKSRAYGTVGTVFPGGVPLNGLPWFKAFRESQGNFSLGLQLIPEEYVRHLYAATRSAGGMTPTEEYTAGPNAPSQSQPGVPAPRRPGVVERIVRDTAVTAEVKRMHGYQCQVCGTRLEMPDGPYAEGAHVRPLGSPHDGPDLPPNVLCLCPNHHVLLDGGAFSIRDDLTLIGLEGRLRTAEGHRIDPAYLLYHRRLFGYESG
jgi:hypothetical protein